MMRPNITTLFLCSLFFCIFAETPWYVEMDRELGDLNRVTAQVEWQLATQPTQDILDVAERIGSLRASWRNAWCKKKLPFQRRAFLLCRGPAYTPMQARLLSRTLGELHSIYTNARLCIPGRKHCFPGEPHLERIMREVRTPEILLWAWHGWRRVVGPKALRLFPTLIAQLNQGAQNNGYSDMGECWREEMEIKNLELEARSLLEKVQPLYQMLHAVTRYALRLYYGSDLVAEKGPIPAHLLGNMWAQSWDSIADIILSLDPDLQKADAGRDVTEAMRSRNYSIQDMVRHAEDYYISLGFEPISSIFWEKSQWQKHSPNASCHASAANMYTGNDFRLLLCAEVTEQDFYVVHHELGHIHYYMAYRHLPVIFQDGANSAFQEAVGDAIWYGVSTPQHMERLGLVNDTLNSQTGDLAFLVRQALGKIPQLPYSLAIDLWRYEVFRGNILPESYNEKWWFLRKDLQGVDPPFPRLEDDFDIASKFHVADNIPYIRYFFSNLLQVQIFKALCQISVTGRAGTWHLPLPLHRCDIYGSKEAGKRLRILMEMGRSKPWPDVLARLTNTHKLSAEPLLEYYSPLLDWLKRTINRLNIPVGWS